MIGERRARSAGGRRLFRQSLFGSHRGRSGGAALLPALLLAAPAMATTFQTGEFVRTGRTCASADDADRLVSNGHSVSPRGHICRVVSRTSSGGYYPIFNERCTGGATDDYRMDVRVSSPERISIHGPAGGPGVAYRHCPSRAAARDGN